MKCGDVRWLRIDWGGNMRLLCVLNRADPLGTGKLTRIFIGPDGATIYTDSISGAPSPSYEVPMAHCLSWGWDENISSATAAEKPTWDWFKGDWKG